MFALCTKGVMQLSKVNSRSCYIIGRSFQEKGHCEYFHVLVDNVKHDFMDTNDKLYRNIEAVSGKVADL